MGTVPTGTVALRMMATRPGQRFRRAAEINRILRESNNDRVPGGVLRIISVNDNSITLRRIWPRALAVAARGLTLEVNKTTGVVTRLGAMGAPLPNLPPNRPPVAASAP